MSEHAPDLEQIVEDCRAYLEDRILTRMEPDEYRRRSHVESVPYGNTMANWTEPPEVTERELLDEAQDAWEHGLIDMDGDLYVVVEL